MAATRTRSPISASGHFLPATTGCCSAAYCDSRRTREMVSRKVSVRCDRTRPRPSSQQGNAEPAEKTRSGVSCAAFAVVCHAECAQIGIEHQHGLAMTSFRTSGKPSTAGSIRWSKPGARRCHGVPAALPELVDRRGVLKPTLLARMPTEPGAFVACSTMTQIYSGLERSAPQYATLTPNSFARPARSASICAASPKPLSMNPASAALGDRAMPKPMPLRSCRRASRVLLLTARFLKRPLSPAPGGCAGQSSVLRWWAPPTPRSCWRPY